MRVPKASRTPRTGGPAWDAKKRGGPAEEALAKEQERRGATDEESEGGEVREKAREEEDRTPKPSVLFTDENNAAMPDGASTRHLQLRPRKVVIVV